MADAPKYSAADAQIQVLSFDLEKSIEAQLRAKVPQLPAAAIKGLSKTLRANPRRHAESLARMIRERARLRVEQQFREEGPKTSHIDDSLNQAHRHFAAMPFWRSGDRELVLLFNGTERDRNIAAQELAKRPDFVSARAGDPRVRRRLSLMGRGRGFRYMVDTVIPAAFLVASDELVTAPRRGRIGREHVVATAGQRVAFNPFDLDDEKLLALLKQRAQAIAEETILDDPALAPPAPPPPATKHGPLARRLTTKRHAATERLLAAVRRNPGALTSITSFEAEVARATVAGASDADIAIGQCKTLGAVRAARHRLLRRLRPA